jgi:hypothetical protein
MYIQKIELDTNKPEQDELEFTKQEKKEKKNEIAH